MVEPTEVKGIHAFREIKITSAKYGVKYLVVDEQDFELVNKHTWYLLKGRYTFYAATNVGILGTKRHHTLLAHRLIMGITEKSIQVDHIDHDGLNDRRSNLRESTHSQNQVNRKSQKNAASSYLGVSRAAQTGGWRALIRVGGKTKTLGYRKDEIGAAKLYDEAAKKHHGEFANLNFK